jgi:pyruvate ferredoxin oxidoreductase alpha subunit
VGYTLGHGGRDIRIESIVKVIEGTKAAAKAGIMVESQFLDLKEELL